jgi:hypothetical protein
VPNLLTLLLTLKIKRLPWNTTCFFLSRAFSSPDDNFQNELSEPYSAPWCVSATQLWFQQYLRGAGACQLEPKPVRSREACGVRLKRHQRALLCHDYFLTLAVSRNKSIRIYSAGFTILPRPYHAHFMPVFGLVLPFLFCTYCTYRRCGNHSTLFVQPFLVFMLRIHISLISGNPFEIGT